MFREDRAQSGSKPVDSATDRSGPVHSISALRLGRVICRQLTNFPRCYFFKESAFQSDRIF
jgi:hypothetical protein